MTTSPVVERLLGIARAELGTSERPHGSNQVKYNTAFYGRPVRNTKTENYAWCAVFQWWCFQKAGIPTSVFPKSANVFAIRDWYKKRGRFDHHPRRGALVIFGFSHIGLVEEVLPDGRIKTIEGNTDAAGGRTGGRVMRKIRSAGIQGYCHPEYQRVRPASVTRPRPVAAKTTTANAARPTSTAPARPGGRLAEYFRTALVADNVRLAANTRSHVQFPRATLNTGGFWTPPVEHRRGYNLATGPGTFIVETALAFADLPPGAEVTYRLVQADPDEKYRIVQAHPETAATAASPALHSTTVGSLGAGNHLWVQIRSTHVITVARVTVEVLLLRDHVAARQ